MDEKNGTSDISYNLFYYAYKELSQDAIICWLIKWAYNDEPSRDPLRECGLEFVKALFAKHEKKAPENPQKLNLWQQDNRIDVLAQVGEYVLLIEDKTGGKDHSNQLKKYYKQVFEGNTKAGKVDNGNILPIYLKTGNQSLFDRLRIEYSTLHEIDLESGKIHPTPYKVFDRRNFLKVVQPYSSAHPILNDFTNYLKYEDDKTQGFKEWREDEDWEENSLSWQGFYRELENHLVVSSKDNDLVGFDNNPNNKFRSLENNWKSNWSKDKPWGWDWVNNPAGGFAGFWWYSKKFKSDDNEFWLYLQLEINLNNPNARKLCFKMYTEKQDRNLAQDCQKCILKSGGDLVRVPARMGAGYTRTIAQWNEQRNDNRRQHWLVFKSNGGPDIQATIKNLLEAQRVLDRVEGIV